MCSKSWNTWEHSFSETTNRPNGARLLPEDQGELNRLISTLPVWKPEVFVCAQKGGRTKIVQILGGFTGVDPDDMFREAI